MGTDGDNGETTTAVVEKKFSALPSVRQGLTDEQVDLIKRTICSGASDDEMALFLYTAKRTGLDPLARQIHAVFRNSKKEGRKVMAIQTGIDGYRLIAQRTGQHAGTDDVVYRYSQDGKLEAASVTVYKMIQNQRVGFTATARWAEYCQLDWNGNLTPMWAKMPYLMLGKCAEALALRKAFPAELSGIYTDDEMNQADADTKSAAAALPSATPTSQATAQPAAPGSAGADELRKELWDWMLEMNGNDEKAAADHMESLTEYETKAGKKYPGRRKVEDFNATRRPGKKVSQLQVVHSQVKKAYDEWKNNGGEGAQEEITL